MSLRAMGIGRDADDPRTLFVIFNREPSDDDMRAVHDLLREGLAEGADTGYPPARSGSEELKGGADNRPFAPLDAYETAQAGEAKDYAAEAAMKCAEPAFKAFLEQCHGLERPLTDERCAQKLRTLCGVTSRAAFNKPGRAAAAWVALRKQFDDWKRRDRR